jgi:hypothetical protein
MEHTARQGALCRCHVICGKTCYTTGMRSAVQNDIHWSSQHALLPKERSPVQDLTHVSYRVDYDLLRNICVAAPGPTVGVLESELGNPRM